jgi:hypothetical protein
VKEDIVSQGVAPFLNDDSCIETFRESLKDCRAFTGLYEMARDL